jgi:HSP20 family protein
MTGRRTSAPVPMLPSPYLPSPRFPSLTSPAQDLAKRANAMVRQALAGMPQLPMVDWFPAINVSESKDGFTLTAELPGLTVTDVTIDYCDGVLTISGEKTDASEATEGRDRRWYLLERPHGSFQRVMRFPVGIAEDRISAEFSNGVLTVRLPKSEETKALHHTIPIAERRPRVEGSVERLTRCPPKPHGGIAAAAAPCTCVRGTAKAHEWKPSRRTLSEGRASVVRPAAWM